MPAFVCMCVSAVESCASITRDCNHPDAIQRSSTARRVSVLVRDFVRVCVCGLRRSSLGEGQKEGGMKAKVRSRGNVHIPGTRATSSFREKKTRMLWTVVPWWLGRYWLLILRRFSLMLCVLVFWLWVRVWPA